MVKLANTISTRNQSFCTVVKYEQQDCPSEAVVLIKYCDIQNLFDYWINPVLLLLRTNYISR